MKGFSGKIVVVTGAGSGIGRALAIAFAEAGARLICADLRPETAEATARECGAVGPAAVGWGCDVTDAAQVAALAERAEREVGPVGILVNNAGVALHGPVEQLSLDDWSWQLGPNLWGVIHGVHAFLPPMLARGEGHIVNIASAAGLVGGAQLVAYCTSKHAVVGMSEALRFELAARGVDVTVICPGFVSTNIFSAARGRGGVTVPERTIARLAITPEALAREVLAAVQRNDPILVATGHARRMVALKRSFPRLWDRLGKLAGKMNLSRG